MSKSLHCVSSAKEGNDVPDGAPYWIRSHQLSGGTTMNTNTTITGAIPEENEHPTSPTTPTTTAVGKQSRNDRTSYKGGGAFDRLTEES